HQGITAASNAAGHSEKMDYNTIPAVIFTTPEIATVGLSLEDAKKEKFDAISGKFPFQALGKAQAAIETDGYVEIVSERKTGQILGATVIGHEAANLIAEMALAIRNELTLDSVIETIHAHPTLAESWLEAALLAADRPIHLPPKKR
ncbi:MAG: dihydrolipoyl dehydrogenase, partial [Chlamydiae bacterium]|nr:dihydrolipoyl dehydrogenase [Chlamydiota bacterium]